jgi:hypothetical protein
MHGGAWLGDEAGAISGCVVDPLSSGRVKLGSRLDRMDEISELSVVVWGASWSSGCCIGSGMVSCSCEGHASYSCMMQYADGARAKKHQKYQKSRKHEDTSRGRKQRGQRTDYFCDRTRKAEGLHSRGDGDLASGTAAVIGVSAAPTRGMIGFEVVRSWV